jgi:tRNA-2-methylthio-N6-dimethylallyladenosine synthase
MNKADSQRFSHILLSLGLPPAASWEEANIIILNSCAVRQSAEVRVKSKLGSLRRWREQGPCRYIVLAGCMVDDNREALRRQYPMVDAFVPAGDVFSLGKAVRSIVPGSGDATTGFMGARDTASGPCRWIPIIYGCNQFCSYCIVPYRRGPERSRPLEEIVAEVEGLVSGGGS